MNYLEPGRLEALSERYVLGTMQRRARRRFGELVDSEPRMARSVYAQEALLMPLAWAVSPVRPSQFLWQRIVRRAGIGGRGDSRQTTPAPVFGPAMAAMLVAGLLVTSFGWWQALNRPPEVIVETVVETRPLQPAVAVVADAGGNTIWVARIFEDLGRVDITVNTLPEQYDGNDYELWVLRDDGVPVSLGLLPQAGERSLELDPDSVDALQRSTTLAVSLEPLGGSPQPVPTGPVLFTAALMAP